MDGETRSPCWECVSMCLHVQHSVRLIEVVRVKMIPSGRHSRWRQWVGSAVGDEPGERDETDGKKINE